LNSVLAAENSLLDAVDVLVHRAADVHQQQHLHLVVALGHQLDVQQAGVGRGAVDGVVEVEFSRSAPSRAKRRSRRSATLMLRVPSSLVSS
jgi:hypothetical protein